MESIDILRLNFLTSIFANKDDQIKNHTDGDKYNPGQQIAIKTRQKARDEKIAAINAAYEAKIRTQRQKESVTNHRIDNLATLNKYDPRHPLVLSPRPSPVSKYALEQGYVKTNTGYVKMGK